MTKPVLLAEDQHLECHDSFPGILHQSSNQPTNLPTNQPITFIQHQESIPRSKATSH